MKRCKLFVLLILTCLLILPVFATAETQQEFELRCNKKTATAASVYSFLNSPLNSGGEVVDHIPAGTYVILGGAGSNNWQHITYMINGNKKSGWVQATIIDCTSVIRKSDGFAYNIHEKDPNYDAKIKEGVLEFDITKYSDQGAYYRYRAGAGPEPERKDGSNAEESQNASQTDTQANEGGTAVGVVELGRTSSKIQYQGKTVSVSTSDLTFSENVPENKKLATIYAPRTGKASLRQTASSKGTLLKNCKAGTIVSVLAIGNGYTRINYKGTVGYIKTACLKFYGDSESTAQGVLSYKGNTGGGTTVNVRNTPKGDSAKVAEWRTGTEVTILSHENGWYEIEANGMHGYVMEKYVTEK